MKGGPVLPWGSRYKVALGIAESIGYLQYGTERCVVHRDIKPSNIPLSSKKTHRLCDFRLATWTTSPPVPFFLCKKVPGTFGYLALEYFQHGKISDKTDVYGFGVIILELLTGRNHTCCVLLKVSNVSVADITLLILEGHDNGRTSTKNRKVWVKTIGQR